MRNRLKLICALVLGLLPLAAVAEPTMTAGSGSEILQVDVPRGWKLAYHGNVNGMQLMQYVPPGESITSWSDMLAVALLARKSAPDIDTFFKAMTVGFYKTCFVPPIVEDPVRFIDRGYEAGTQTIVCGRGQPDGTANVLIYKMIAGRKGFYQVQRSWDFPAAKSSHDVPFTSQMRQSGLSQLKAAHLCTAQPPRTRC